MNARFLLLVFLGAITLLRWVLGASRELSPAEAYLALCGFAPAVAYFDGPAGTALGVAWGTVLAGAGGLGASLLWPAFAAAASLALYLLVRPLAGLPAACASVVLLNLLPAFNSAALHPSAALPLAMFSLLFLAAAWRALDQPSPWWWLASGFTAAGALLFSYAGLFLLPALALVLLLTRRWRPGLLRPGFWLATVPVLAALALLLAWNNNHGWVHFIGGTWRTALSLDITRLPAAFLSALHALTPLVLPALAVAVFFAFRSMKNAPKARFLAIPAGTAVLMTLYAVMRGTDTLTPALTAVALSLPLLAWIPAALARYSLPLVMITASIWTAVTLALQPAPPPDINAAVAREIETLRKDESARAASPVFLIAENAPLASALALYLPDLSFVVAGHPPVYVPESPFADSQYALWPRYDQFIAAPAGSAGVSDDPFTEQDGVNPFLGRSALYVTTQTADQLPQSITAAFASWRPLTEVTAPSGTVLRVYLCTDYQTLPL